MRPHASASDAAFATLSVGVHFTRDRFQHQRQLFEDSTTGAGAKPSSANKNSSRAAPLSSDAAADLLSGHHHHHHVHKATHELITALPPPRLDFLTKALQANNNATSTNDGKKSKNGNADSDDDENNKNGDDDESNKHKPLPEMGRKQVGNFLKRHDVTVKGTNFTHPGAVPVDRAVTHFSELVRPPLAVSPQIVDRLFARELTKATTIQSLAIPLLLAGRNVIGCAPTGSGKTIAFLVPMFKLLKQPDKTSEGPRALIVAPTKELAAQIERESQFLMKGAPWRVVTHGKPTSGRDVFITTPARAVAMAENKAVVLTSVKYLVFDEGDKLWASGSDFGPQVKQIVSFVTGGDGKIENDDDDDDDDAADDGGDTTTTTTTTKEKKSEKNKKRDLTVAFFSATLGPKAERLARSFMPDAVLVVIRGRVSANVDCEQKLVFAGNELGKVTAIKNMVTDGDMRPPVLIFMQSIERSKELFDEIRASGLKVAVLNAQLSSEDRDRIVLKFRMGEIWVLITTELLARGVDFKGVNTVINFDLPLTAESYVHRIGRTGRAGKRGRAITFFTEEDKFRLPPIVKIVHESGSEVAPYLLEMKQPTPKQVRALRRSVPERLAVSTRKRMRIGEDRIMRQANKYCRRDGEGDSDDDDDDDDGRHHKQQKNKGGGKGKKAVGGGDDDNDDDLFAEVATRKKKSRRKIPNASEDFE